MLVQPAIFKLLKINFLSIFIAVSFVFIALLQPANAHALVVNAQPSANISFTFDDGLNSVATQAAPVLSKYGLTGTSYVVTNCIGMVTTPNTCRADSDKTYMTWIQVKDLQNINGWEIGSHTVTHPYLATKDASDGQPKVLTAAQVDAELKNSKAALTAQGINATAFAAPYGDYNPKVLAQIAKYYSSNRGFADVNNNIWPNNAYLINNYQVQAGVSVDQVKAKIDQAIAGKNWLTLTFHDIKINPSTDPDDYEYSTSGLDQIASYVKSKQVAGLLKNVNVSNGIVSGSNNLFTNSTFNNGITAGWTKDSTTVTANAANNGSFPDSANSVKMVSSTKNVHLFSPKVSVSSNSSYLFKSFLNVQSRTSGVVGYYVDEYDNNGNWVSGQYKASEQSIFVEEINFPYVPSSANVKQSRLQIIVSANSGITAFVDNVQMYSSVDSPVQPEKPNLVPNSTLDAGISQGWTTNSPSTIVADSSGSGSPANPTNSVKVTATSSNTHLFSPKVAVNPLKTYTLSCYINMLAILTGELGFYIDEYDESGNWISGQYVGGVRSAGKVTNLIQYKPSSSAVKSASLQFIVMGNSGIQGFIDNLTWLEN